MNVVEHHKIKNSLLPDNWKDEDSLDKLQAFLQTNWEQRAVFYDDGTITSKQQFIDFDKYKGIKTKNYIGTICFAGETLNIFPKVYMRDDNDDETEDWNTETLVKNLVSWLNYCNKFEFPFVSIDSGLTNETNLFELLVSVFVHYVKRALEIAPYRRYEEINEEGSVIKGKIDFNAYARRQIPNGNWNKVSYSFSNFMFDNKVNQIIKATCNMLHKQTEVPRTQDLLRNILIRLGEVSDISCMPTDCDHIHLSKLHSKYIVLLSMCKMFLLNKINNTKIGTSNSYCFLFPTELLFEGFVGGYLQELFVDTATVRCQTSDQYLAHLYINGKYKGQAFNLREDIIIQQGDKLIVADTKYKMLKRFSELEEEHSTDKKFGISDADMKQMAVYAIKRNASKLYLIYPLYREEPLETTKVAYRIPLDHEYEGKEVELEILKIPFVFDGDEVKYQQRLNSVLSKIL